MKMKKFIKLVDFLTTIRIFTPDDGDEPEWEGYLLEMPWYYLDYKIGRPAGDDEEPIYIYYDEDKRHNIMVINLLPKEYEK